MAHTRQSRPDFCIGFQAKVLEILKEFPLCSDAEHDQPVSSVGAPLVTVLVTVRGHVLETVRFREQL